MSFPSIKSLLRLPQRFRMDTRGNVAVIFALVAIPLVALVGAAVDYTRESSNRSALQSALDSAALMISKDASSLTDATAVTNRARQYVDSLYTAPDAPIQTFTATYTPNTGSGASILLTAGGTMPTYFMKVLGSQFSTLAVKASSTTKWGSSRMRVALVLDNTGSMDDNGKMDALKVAVNGDSTRDGMITKLSRLSNTEGDLYISIVPFAKDVNVDTSNVNASWLDWSEWEAEPAVLTANNYPINVKYNNITYTWADIGPGAPCPFDSSGSSKPTQNSSVSKFSFSCMDRPGTLSGAKDLSNVSSNKFLIPSSGNYAGMICPGVDGGAKYPGKTGVYYNGCYTSVVDTAASIVKTGSSASCSSTTPNCSCTGTGSSKVCTQTKYKHYWRTHPSDTAKAAAAAPAHSTWTGCVNDRNQNDDTTLTPMTGSGRVYPEQWKDCLPATITPMSNGWESLKTQISAMTPSGNTNQAIGMFWGWQTLNTANDPFKAPAKDANWVYQDYVVILSDGMNTQNRWSKTQKDIDARQATLCQNIKNAGIKIFTIQVNIDSKDSTSKVLQNCASSPTDGFQIITQSGDTAQAFDKIVDMIAKLRIAQ